MQKTRAHKMLSSAYVSVGQASTYYEKDQCYYDAQIGEYRGRLKETLGLEDLTHDTFQNLIRGNNPITGESLVSSKGTNQKRAAIDLTFTAPKSVSVLLEIAQARGNGALERLLLESHDKAVNKSLDRVENVYAASRVQKNGKRKIEKTGNLIIAKFQHDTSRELDPTLHTHSVVMNFTQCADGKFRSIEAGKLLKDNKINGLYYRAELAKILQEEGVEIVITDKERMFFELKNVDKSLLEEFSQRAPQVEAKFQELKAKFPNMSEKKLMQSAKLQSRKVKDHNVDRDAVRNINLERAEKLVDVDKLLQKFNPKQQPQNSKEVVQSKDEVEKEVKEVLFKVEKELKQSTGKSAKWEQREANVLASAVKELFGKVRASVISLIQNKVSVEKIQKIQTMHSLLIESLHKTKLNTQELFKLNSQFVNIDRHQIEEKIENARTTIGCERINALRSNRDLASSIAGTEHTHDRDAANIDRKISAPAERDRDNGAEFKRDDDAHARGSGANYPSITKHDIALAEQGGREQQLKNQHQEGIEK
ncbi:MAG: MobF family relaxase [Sulfurimonas sp.]|nr:MobF family relaxase [Sulfurimonas sp.]